MLPQLIVHADWSVHSHKRWMVCAFLDTNSSYIIETPEPVGELSTFLYRIKQRVNRKAAIMIGFDFPIGIPLAYARKAGIKGFLSLLPQLGKGEWKDFYRVAETSEQIHIHRPFYPNKPGSKCIRELLDGLNLSQIGDLRRQCEYIIPSRRTASPLFWTLGAQQVGKAAINGWKEVIFPGLMDDYLNIAIWPFSGNLFDLLNTDRMILVETYPSEYLIQIVSPLPGKRFSKRSHIHRMNISSFLLEWADKANVKLETPLVELIKLGFKEQIIGEDMFDAFVGLCKMIDVVTKWNPCFEPKELTIREIEGWIFGKSVRHKINNN